jgi:hypothetical protein
LVRVQNLRRCENRLSRPRSTLIVICLSRWVCGCFDVVQITYETYIT